MFCKVRFIVEPVSNKMETQVMLTWGTGLRRYDYWAYTSCLRYTFANSAARPLIINIQGI